MKISNVSFLAAGLLLVQISQAAPATTSSSTPTTAPVTGAVQFDISTILNARPVITLGGDGKVVPIRGGVDVASGLITTAAADALGVKDDHALPDDGRFPATADRPEVVLQLANKDGTANQVHRSAKLPKVDEYAFNTTPGKYQKLFLFFTSAASGPAQVKVSLTYQDGSAEAHDGVIPDWYKDLAADDKDHVYLVSNLSKWGGGDKLKMLEKNHHNIVGLVINSAPDKVLTQIKIRKDGPFVVFWAAAGQLAQ